MVIVLLVLFHIIIDIFPQFLTFSNFELFEHNLDFLNSNLTMMASSCCGRQEEPAILISRLLLRMRHIYVASIRLDFHREWMECTERNLITRVLTNCHMKLTQSTVIEQKRFDLLSLSPALCNLWLLLVILFFSSNLSWKTVEASLSATLHLACFPLNRIIQTRGHWLGIFIWPSRSGGLGRRNLSES